MNVIVTNKNAEPFKGKFDGTSYEFAPGEPVTIPALAARFLFGFGGGDADVARVLVRNGWQKNGSPADPMGPVAAMKRLQGFSFASAPDDPAPEKPKAKVLKPKVITKTQEPEVKAEVAPPLGLPMKSRGQQISLPGRSAPLAPSAAQ